MPRRSTSADKNTTELAIAFDNVIQLVDIARNDIVELDKILKTGVNGQPSILIELDRLKNDILTLEEKLNGVDNQYVNLKETKTNKTEVIDHEKRLKYLERMVWSVLGGLTAGGALVIYGASIIKVLKEFFTITPI